MLRTLLFALIGPVVAGSALVPGALAQQQPKPASQEDLFTYNRMGAVNICYLVSTGVPLKKAFPSSMVMIGDVIVGKHRSEILEGKKTIKLEPQQIETGSVIGMMGNIKVMCADKFKGDDKKNSKLSSSKSRKLLGSKARINLSLLWDFALVHAVYPV